MTASVPPEVEHPIAVQLRQAGITKAAIIDDAFDLPERDGYREEILAFWDSVIRDDELMGELRVLRPEISDESDIDDELLGLLWSDREKLQRLGAVAKSVLFAEKLDDLTTLDRLSSHLVQLGVSPITIGSQGELPDEPIKLVFIDYRLGRGTGSEPVNAATARAKAIYGDVGTDADKPFMVLMSSRPDAAAAKDNFREGSRLLGGLFGYVPKKDLEDRESLQLHLATWAIGMPTRHDIQHFVEALETAARNAAEEFSRRVRSLGFEDYANIQWLSLEPDGQPLGDYMLWLYKALLAYLFHDNPGVLAQQKKLDAMSFGEFTPSQGAPSPELGEIYRFALTEPGVEDVGGHPRVGKSGSEPLLKLGDLFFKDQAHDVLMVINASCDLTYSPGKATRPFPKDRPILLLRGVLQRHEDINISDWHRTEMFKHDGKVYRILWDHRGITSKEYGKISSWLRQEGYARKARLILPYALQVQQAFAMHVMRIGMPIRPPSYRYADVEVYCEGQDGGCVRIGEPIQGGALIVRRRMEDDDRDEDLFVLNLGCIGTIVAKLDVAIEMCEQLKAQLAAEVEKVPLATADGKQLAKEKRGRIKGLEGKLTKLQQLKRISEQWVPMIRAPRPLPGIGKKQEVDKKLLWVFRDKVFEGAYNEGPPIVLNIALEKTSSSASGVLELAVVEPRVVGQVPEEPGQ